MKSKKEDDWEYVEVKTGKARQTKAQRAFEKEVKRKGGKYTLQRESPWF